MVALLQDLGIKRFSDLSHWSWGLWRAGNSHGICDPWLMATLFSYFRKKDGSSFSAQANEKEKEQRVWMASLSLGEKKIPLGFTPWFAAHFLALIEKANRLSKSCSQERATLGSFVWNNSDVQWLLGQSTAGLGALLFITGAAPLQKITFTHNSHQ